MTDRKHQPAFRLRQQQLTRRVLLRGIAGTAISVPMAGLLAACGGDDEIDAGRDNRQPAATPGAGGGDETDQGSTPTNAGSGDTDSGARTVEHLMGATEVPAVPRRIAGLDHTIVSNLVSVGVAPGVMPADSLPWLDVYREILPPDIDLSAVPVAGENYEPDLEQIAVAGPDVILVHDYTAEEIYDRLSAIAPTVVFEWISNGAWRERFDKQMAAISREAEAEAVRERYQRMIDELSADVRAVTVAFIRPDSDGQFRLDSTDEAFAGSVVAGAGIPSLEAPEGAGEIAKGSGFMTLSEERLGVLEDADLIVVADWAVIGLADEPGLTIFERNALWARLPAVQAGRVISLPGPIYNGGNYLAAELMLRAIAEAVAGGDTGAATRQVVDAYGETIAIPANPQRVVVFDRRGTLAYLLDLGIKPVGAMSAPQIYGGEHFHPLIQTETAGITPIQWGEPDLELVATLRPDLIVGYPGDGLEEAHEQLKAMAATVAVPIDFNNPQEELRVLGGIFGMEDRAEDLIKEFQNALATAKSEIANPGSVSILLALEDGVRVYTDENLVGQVVTGLGGTVAPDVEELGADPSGYFALLSLERVSEITGETLVLMANLSEELGEHHEAFLKHPLVQLLPPVQAGRVVEVETQAVFGTAGLRGQYQILDQLMEAFTT